ncbi:MAG TPA: ribonuclease III [Gammaproteobacteria bacterium]|nr:ribonuclease III [Gammaproteobacteria bacterium]
MTDDRGWLERELGYRFKDEDLLARALTHRSAGGRHNERLEFLGDAALSLVVAEALYQRLPDAPEGHLSRLRASLVRRSSLAEVARGLGFPGRLRLGPGELKSGGFRRDSILADALEAVLGAIYLDGGLDALRTAALHLYGDRLDDLPAHEDLKDPKTLLQERLQARGLPLPTYRLEAVAGEDHRQQFTVSCEIEGLADGASGTGGSRRAAEQAAAARVLAQLDG